MFLKSYIVFGGLVCFSFAVAAAMGWKAPDLGILGPGGGSGFSSSSGGPGGYYSGGRWTSGSGGWGGGK